MESHGKDQDVSKNTVSETGPTEAITPTPASSDRGWPMLPLYYAFQCCAKPYTHIDLEGNNKLYHRICNYVYSTDGQFYHGHIENGELVGTFGDLWYDYEEPDWVYCACCMPCYFRRTECMRHGSNVTVPAASTVIPEK
jgi:hypothetical protein